MKKPICAITAATSGLGQELAKIFAANGYSLFLHARNEAVLNDLTLELKKTFKIDIKTYHGDLRNENVLHELSTMLGVEKCDVLINNAGEGCPGIALEEFAETQIKDLLNVNLYSPIILSKGMLANKNAVIININSIMAIEPKAKRSVYSAVRAGLMGFTEAMYSEKEAQGIRFIGVYPSRIKTRPEYDFGMETKEVAEKIFNFFKNEKGSKLILDGRPRK